MRFLPTRPELLPKPWGWAALSERSSSREVPIPLPHSTTAFAAMRCSVPARSSHRTPVARPSEPVSTRRTLAPVTSVAPDRVACGHQATSLDAFALSGQPHSHTPQRAHADRFLKFWLGMALAPGHQCQPSLLAPWAAQTPALPMGSGGSG